MMMHRVKIAFPGIIIETTHSLMDYRRWGGDDGFTSSTLVSQPSLRSHPTQTLRRDSDLPSTAAEAAAAEAFPSADRIDK